MDKITINKFVDGYKQCISDEAKKNYLKRTLWTLKNYHSYDFSCNYAPYSIIGSKLALAASKNNSFYIHSDYYNVFNQNIEEFKRFFLPHKIDKFRNIIFVSNESKKNFLKV